MEKKTHDVFKTSYQRAHYYENVQQSRPILDSRNKTNIRSDLYVYDPIINEKQSIYKKSYNKKKFNEKNFESYGRLYLTSKYTLKNLYDEFYCKAPKSLKYYTTSDFYFKNPSENVETKLLQNFCTESTPKEINRTFTRSYTEFIQPYISTSHSVHNYLNKTNLNVPEKDDSAHHLISLSQKYEKKRNCLFKVPFRGDVSTYKESYQIPHFKKPKSTFVDAVCILLNSFEDTKVRTGIQGTYDTEQKLIGSGKRIQAVI